jgi:hypothetical protein
MLTRILTSAVFPAVALPALAFGHAPGTPAFGISRAVHLVTSTVSSVTWTGGGTAPRAATRHALAARRSGARDGARDVVIDCTGSPVVRPKTFLLACADGNDRLAKMDWADWDSGYAMGTGVQVLNDCSPSCARGTFRDYPVRVILWGSASVPGQRSERRYEAITLLYTGHAPQVGGGSARMAGPLSVTGTLWD